MSSALALVVGVAGQPAIASNRAPPETPGLTDARSANFGAAMPSAEARRVADWIVGSSNNDGLPFIIVDKVNARLFLFGAAGVIRADVPVLVGSARGDDSAAGVGDRPLSAIAPAERTTPAGRFVAQRGRDLSGADILWVDYDTAIALHRASDKKPGLTAKSRLQRLASTTIADNRASYGCIGVSADFYDRFISSTFQDRGIVYILPETRPVSAEFHMPPRRAYPIDDTGV